MDFVSSSFSFSGTTSGASRCYSSSGSQYSPNLPRTLSTPAPKKITRKNLAEQLREYQQRKGHDWASANFFGKIIREDEAPRISLCLILLGVLLLATMVALCVGYAALAWVYLALAFLLVIALFLSQRCQKGRRRQRRLLP